MGKKCRKTCHLCEESSLATTEADITEVATTDAGCFDNLDFCEWLSCADEYVRQNCRKSCGLCSDFPDWTDNQDFLDWTDKPDFPDWTDNQDFTDWTDKPDFPDWTDNQDFTDWTNKPDFPDWTDKPDFPDWTDNQNFSEWTTKQVSDFPVWTDNPDFTNLTTKEVCEDDYTELQCSQTWTCKSDFTKPHCRKTCGLCTGCYDLYTYETCHEWLACDDDYLRGYCKKTCGICSDDTGATTEAGDWATAESVTDSWNTSAVTDTDIWYTKDDFPAGTTEAVCEDELPEKYCSTQWACNSDAFRPKCRKSCNLCMDCYDNFSEATCSMDLACNVADLIGNCRKTCGVCKDTVEATTESVFLDCEDEFSEMNCTQSWSCESDFFRPHCRKSCGLCGGCVDTFIGNVCNQDFACEDDYVSNHCRRTCGLCTDSNYALESAYQKDHPKILGYCINSCKDPEGGWLPTGDYQSCESCYEYVTCYQNALISNRPCPDGLVWDDYKKRCEWISETCS